MSAATRKVTAASLASQHQSSSSDYPSNQPISASKPDYQGLIMTPGQMQSYGRRNLPNGRTFQNFGNMVVGSGVPSETHQGLNYREQVRNISENDQSKTVAGKTGSGHDQNSGGRQKTETPGPSSRIQHPTPTPVTDSAKKPASDSIGKGVIPSSSQTATSIHASSSKYKLPNSVLEPASRPPEKPSLASAGSTSITTQASLPRSRERGLVGLRNLGNTCFMNSILQCVAHTPRFIESMLGNSELNRRSKLKGQLAEQFGELMQEMRRAHSAVSPEDVKRMVGRFAPQFNGYAQQDAHEFLRFLLDGLHEDLNRVQSKEPYRELKSGSDYSKVAAEWLSYHNRRDDSLVMDHFRGQLLTIITCGRCQGKSAVCDTFLDLSVPIPNHTSGVTLESCIADFTSESEVEGFKCEICGKTSRSRMEMTIWKFPLILVVHLKRFSNSSWRRQKIDTEVRFPIERLDMRQFAPHSSDPSAVSPTYSLFGVSHHMGDLGFGHYIA